MLKFIAEMMAVRVADGDGKRVCGIFLSDLREIEQRFGHLLNLIFSGSAITDDRAFHLKSRIFRDRQPGVDARQESDPPSVTEFERRCRIACHENLLNGNRIRAVPFYQGAQILIDFLQPQGQRVLAARENRAVVDMNQPVALLFYKAVAGRFAARVNTEDTHGQEGLTHDLFHLFVRDVEVGVNVLDIVIIFQNIDHFH